MSLQSTKAKLALAATLMMPAAAKLSAQQANAPAPGPTNATQAVEPSTTANYEPAQYYYGSPYGYPVEGALIEPVCPTVSLFARLGPIGIYGSPLGYGCYWPTYPGFVVELDRDRHGFFYREGGRFPEGFHPFRGGDPRFVHNFDVGHGGYGGGRAFQNVHPPQQGGGGFHGGAPQQSQRGTPSAPHFEPRSNFGGRAPSAPHGSPRH